MTPLRQRMIEDLQLRGLSAKTQDSYVRAVRQLAEHYHKAHHLAFHIAGGVRLKFQDGNPPRLAY